MTNFFSRFNHDYFFSVPAQTKIVYVWLGFFLFVFVGDLILYFVYRKKGKKEKPYLSFAKKILITEIPISLVALFLVFCRFEGLRVYSYRLWIYLILIALVVADVWLFRERRKLKEELILFHSEQRKGKWLKKKKR